MVDADGSQPQDLLFRCDGRARRRCPRLSFRRRGRPIVAAIRWVIESTRLLRVPRVTNAEEGRAPGSRTDEATSARNTRKAAYSISAYSPRAGLGGNSEPTAKPPRWPRNDVRGQILTWCVHSTTVAEIAARLSLRLGATRFLVDDLVTQGYLRVRAPLGDSMTIDERRELITRTLAGLRAL
jgi:hypothetical protein